MGPPWLHSVPAPSSSRAARSVESNRFPPGRLTATVLLAACWLGFSLAAQAGQQVLKGHVPPITKKLTPVGRLDRKTHLDLAIGLPLRNRDQLTNLLQDLYQPSSANFRHYLKPDQFTASFGPTPEDYQAVADFAKSHGLTVKGLHPNRTLLDVSGSVAEIEDAFHVKMQLYQHPTEARTFFAPDVEPSLDLATPVLAITGLDSYVRPRPRQHWSLKSLTNSAPPLVRPLRGGGGDGGGGGTLAGGYGGYDFRSAYVPNFSQDGTGQSLGLFELAGYGMDDIESYESESGLAPTGTITNIYIDGATGYDGSDGTDQDLTLMDYYVEVTGDIEMAIAMAPGLDNVLVYEGPTPLDEPPANPTNFVQYASVTAQVNDVLNRMATDNLAKQLSSSYILDINLSTIQIYQQFAAQGQSFFQASGDSGAYPGFIDATADDPYLTVVGGTTLSTDSDGNWASETVWLTPAGMDEFGDATPLEASGGGISFTYPIPDWQQGISMTANQGSTTMRNLPDVSLVANNVTVVWGNDFADGALVDLLGDDFPTGGTSLATPLWAGFMALVNQEAAAEGKPPVGFANPALYAIAKSTNYNACFHDITTGNDFNPASPTKYSATPGYDLCSGWGTINTNLLDALLNPPVDSLLVTPPLGFTSIGPGGGPYTMTSQTYTLKNIGTTALSWSLSNSAAWLTVSPASGSLNPGASTTVNASLNAAANNFMIVRYSADVAFSNLSSGTYQNRQFDIYAGNGGFETGDFTYWSMVGDTNAVFTLEGDDTDVGGTNAIPGVDDAVFVHSGMYGAYLGESNIVGSLSQTVTTQPGQMYAISFWLTSLRYQGKTTPNVFSASWNGANLYAQTNLGAFGWTNLQYVVRATSAQTTLRFNFKNIPAAFGLDDITVEPAPAPVLQTATLAGGNLTFTWSATANLSYQIQSAASLSNPYWTNVAAAVTAAGNSVSASEPVGPTSSQRYYRVILLPRP